MVKFSRQLDAQMIPEWKEAFVNYRQLKKNVKKIKFSRPSSDPHHAAASAFPFPNPIARLLGRHHRSTLQVEQEEQDEVELVHPREDEVRLFFERLDDELDKVNKFYQEKEGEFVERGEILCRQLDILRDLKYIVNEHRRRRKADSLSGRGLSGLSSPSMFSDSGAETGGGMLSEMASPTGEMIEVLESHGVLVMGTVKAKAKKGGKPRTTSMRIDIPPTTPTRAISALSSVIWEDIVNSSGGGNPGKERGDYITRKKIQSAEKMIRNAYVELYRGLGLLRTFSTLNMMAFRKILKKYDKVANREESNTYMQKVRRSHFASSDKVLKLSDEVEAIFTKHFANNDRKKTMKFLRPQQPKNSHTINFFVGLFTGCFATLFSMYVILAHLSRVFSSAKGGRSRYMEAVYPIFSMFALISLHIFLYGCNLNAWRKTRINHNFIFGFSSHTALKPRDAFLIAASLMTTVVGAMVAHLILLFLGISPHHVDAIPGMMLLLFLVVLFCPFNICYRSTRFCFLRVIRNIIMSPLYRVYMADFFMADQLCSQIPLMRYMEFTSCFFMAGGFKRNPYETCSGSWQFKQMSHIISLLPYFWRAMQCLRRYMEEGYDMNHVANCGKYVSALVAATVRMKYAVDPTPAWQAAGILTSAAATLYQLYWDFVKDWGFFCRNSRNPYLRDDLVLRNKTIYYFSICLNFVLRLAWIESICNVNLGNVENRMLEFLLSSLEVIRRGHWNFYRLENEHLNNVGKFRAVKAVPLPFREIDSD